MQKACNYFERYLFFFSVNISIFASNSSHSIFDLSTLSDVSYPLNSLPLSINIYSKLSTYEKKYREHLKNRAFY